MVRRRPWLAAVAALGVLGVASSGHFAAWQASLPDALRDPQFWWRTPDQQGAEHFAAGDFAGAARLFADPAWRGNACYRSGDLACAEAAFAQSGLQPGAEADASYNRGNVAARAGRWPDAVAHYEDALRLRPGWREAEDNRRLVLAAIDRQAAASKKRIGEGDDPQDRPDGTVTDEKGKHGKPGQLTVEQLDDASLARMLLRNVRTDPGDYLRLRFADEVSRQSESGLGRKP